MKVYVNENGERPSLWTLAGQDAPLAATALTHLLAEMEWAQDAQIIIDWNGSLSPPSDAQGDKKPYMHIIVRASPDGSNYCLVRSIIDIEDTFGKDTLERDDLITIIDGLKEALNQEFIAFQQGDRERHGLVHYPDA